MSVASLTPSITRILTAPGVDLSSISAKAVRRQLLATDSTLDEEWVREHKREIDVVISKVFQSISSAAAHQDEPEPEPEHEPEPESKPPPALALPPSKPPVASSPKPKVAPPAPANNAHISDAQYARQLSAEINNRPTRASSSGSSGNKRKRGDGNGRSKKSKTEIEDSDDDGGEEDGEKKKKKARGGFAKEYILSPALASIADVPALSRPQVVKVLWDYIKTNSLQNPNDKREIVCDDKLKAVFGVSKINMFTMNKLIGNHLSLPGETS